MGIGRHLYEELPEHERTPAPPAREEYPGDGNRPLPHHDFSSCLRHLVRALRRSFPPSVNHHLRRQRLTVLRQGGKLFHPKRNPLYQPGHPQGQKSAPGMARALPWRDRTDGSLQQRQADRRRVRYSCHRAGTAGSGLFSVTFSVKSVEDANPPQENAFVAPCSG